MEVPCHQTQCLPPTRTETRIRYSSHSQIPCGLTQLIFHRPGIRIFARVQIQQSWGSSHRIGGLVVKLAVAIRDRISNDSASPGFDSRPMHFCTLQSAHVGAALLVLLMGRGHGMLGGDGEWPCSRTEADVLAVVLNRLNFWSRRS
jgi:hypothetical protein